MITNRWQRATILASLPLLSALAATGAEAAPGDEVEKTMEWAWAGDKPQAYAWSEGEGEERRVFVWRGGHDEETGLHFMPLMHHFGGGFLGVDLVDLSPELRRHFGAPEEAGVMVSRVVEDSPAARSRIEVGDVITAVDGEKVVRSFDLGRKIRAKEEGQQVQLEVWRGGKRLSLAAAVEMRQPQLHKLRRLEALPEIDPKTLDQARERLHHFLQSPEGQARVFALEGRRESVEKLQQQIQQLEKRLAELQAQIDALSKKKQ